MSEKVVRKVIDALRSVEDKLLKETDFCEEDFDQLQTVREVVMRMLFEKEAPEEKVGETTQEILLAIATMVEETQQAQKTQAEQISTQNKAISELLKQRELSVQLLSYPQAPAMAPVLNPGMSGQAPKVDQAYSACSTGGDPFTHDVAGVACNHGNELNNSFTQDTEQAPNTGGIRSTSCDSNPSTLSKLKDLSVKSPGGK